MCVSGFGVSCTSRRISLVPVLVQFGLETPLVSLLLMAEVRVKSFSVGADWPWLSGVVVDDLPGSSVAGHAGLRCSFVCAHLQADDIPAFAQLLLGEIPPVLLGLPVHVQTHNVSVLCLPFLRTN